MRRELKRTKDRVESTSCVLSISGLWHMCACVCMRADVTLHSILELNICADIAAAEEEKKVRIIEEDVSIKAKICEADLRRAEPSLAAANEALNTLNKNNLTELKSFGMPPKAVINVCAAVLVLFSGSTGKIPKDRSWRACKVRMNLVSFW